MAGQPADEGPQHRQSGSDAGPEQRAGTGAGSLWAGTPAATGAEPGAGSRAGTLWAGARAAAGGAAASDEPGAGSARSQGSLWAGTPSGAADLRGDAEPDLARRSGGGRGGLFAGTPAGAVEDEGSGHGGAAQGAAAVLAAATEPGHLLDFVRDGASMLVRSAVLQARRTRLGNFKVEGLCFLAFLAPSMPRELPAYGEPAGSPSARIYGMPYMQRNSICYTNVIGALQACVNKACLRGLCHTLRVFPGSADEAAGFEWAIAYVGAGDLLPRDGGERPLGHCHASRTPGGGAAVAAD